MGFIYAIGYKFSGFAHAADPFFDRVAQGAFKHASRQV